MSQNPLKRRQRDFSQISGSLCEGDSKHAADEAPVDSEGGAVENRGTGGVEALQEVKTAGGITFAQKSESASHQCMPLRAIQSGWIVFVLPPGSIARELVRIAAIDC
jgi:two-component system CheB/CheR fusion protein